MPDVGFASGGGDIGARRAARAVAATSVASPSDELVSPAALAPEVGPGMAGGVARLYCPKGSRIGATVPLAALSPVSASLFGPTALPPSPSPREARSLTASIRAGVLHRGGRADPAAHEALDGRVGRGVSHEHFGQGIDRGAVHGLQHDGEGRGRGKEAKCVGGNAGGAVRSGLGGGAAGNKASRGLSSTCQGARGRRIGERPIQGSRRGRWGGRACLERPGGAT